MGMKKIFILMLCLGSLISNIYPNQAQSQNPFDKKIYLPGDFFEYILKGRGPVPALKDLVPNDTYNMRPDLWFYPELEAILKTKTSKQYSETDTIDDVLGSAPLWGKSYVKKFTDLMKERLEHCNKVIDKDPAFAKKHAEHCKIAVENLIILYAFRGKYGSEI